MQALLRAPQAPWMLVLMALAGLAIFSFALVVLMIPAGVPVGDRMAELTCLQVAFTPGRYRELFLSFPPEARNAITQLLFPGDTVFAWGYGLLLAGLTGLVAMRLQGVWFRAGAIVMWLPLSAAVLDNIENTFLYALATRLTEQPEAVIPALLPLLAGIAAVLKYTALSVITPVYGAVAIYHGIRLDHSVGACLLYAVYGLLLISMVQRPLMQLAGCF